MKLSLITQLLNPGRIVAAMIGKRRGDGGAVVANKTRLGPKPLKAIQRT